MLPVASDPQTYLFLLREGRGFRLKPEIDLADLTKINLSFPTVTPAGRMRQPQSRPSKPWPLITLCYRAISQSFESTAAACHQKDSHFI
jgi:hypothetical protein